ncbi:MAG: sigma-70 family RNA polymerase sigma factor [Bacteroidaceae bacterium]|nr:sigma-70 family RNA polymerase sigma factor [Bacteroidaceae bacterium]
MDQLKQEKDGVLVKLYEEGNDDAFDVLLERYQKAVFGYITTVVHDVDLANDIFQDTFMRVIMQIRAHHYVDNGKFSSWVMRIAHNLMIDGTRQRKPFVEIADPIEKERVLNDPSLVVGNAETSDHNEQTFKTLESLVTRLPESQQEIVRMRMYERLSFKEIAEKKGCSINTALGRMRYAILNLRKMSASKDLTLIEME